MRYCEPELRPLDAKPASGDSRSCFDGSTADFVDPCATGQGDEGTQCSSGAGAGTTCNVGTAAAFGEPGCEAGNSPDNWCVSGGDDSGP